MVFFVSIMGAQSKLFPLLDFYLGQDTLESSSEDDTEYESTENNGSNSDDSSDNDDDRWRARSKGFEDTMLLLYLNRSKKRRRGKRGYYCRPKSKDWYRNVIWKYNDKEFRQTVRLSKQSFSSLVDAIENDPVFHNDSKHPQSSVELQLAVFLKRLGSKAHNWDIAQLFGISYGTIGLFCARVMKAIKNLRHRAVIWPSGRRRDEIKQGFFEKAGFPGVIGAIDGTHINLFAAPNVDHKDTYFSRHHRYAIQLQAICDHQGLIISYSIGWPGSVHDSKVYRHSHFYIAESKTLAGDEHIIGDAAYPLSGFLITPYRGTVRGTPEREFNRLLSKTRVIIENVFAFLKNRFPFLKLLRVRDIHTGIGMIECALIIHNILQREGDIWTAQDCAQDGNQEEIHHNVPIHHYLNDTNTINTSRVGERQNGILKRNQLMERMVMNNR